jgi:hypothetical protein
MWTEPYVLQLRGVETRELSAIVQAPQPEERHARGARHTEIRRDTIELVKPSLGTAKVAIAELRFQCSFVTRNVVTRNLAPRRGVAKPVQLTRGHDRHR